MTEEGGREHRALATKARYLSAKERTISAFHAEAERCEMEILAQSPEPTTENSTQWHVHMERFIESLKEPMQRHVAQRELAEASRSLLQRWGVPGHVWEVPIKFTPIASARSPDGFRFAATLDRLDAVFRKRVGDACADRSANIRTWTGLAMWSAISRSQLNMPEHLDALGKWLCEPDSAFGRGVQERTSIRLVIRPTSKHRIFVGNHWTSSSKTELERVHHFHPDILTLVLLKRARQLINAQAVTRIDPYRCLQSALEQGEGRLPSLKAICKHARWLADVRPGLRVSECMLSVADGSRDNVGLDDAGHDLLFGGRTRTHSVATRALSTDAAREPDAELSELTTRTAASDAFLKLEEILHKKKGRYLQGRAAAQRLQDLRDAIEWGDTASGKGSIEHLLVCWLYHLVADKKLKTSSLATYFSRIGAALYEAFKGLMPASVDPETLGDIYESILARFIDGGSTQMNAWQCLAQFHRFSYSNGGLPQLLEELSFEGNQFVRSRALPYWKLREVCDRLSAKHPGPEGRVLILATLIAYRGGLRAGEVCGLAARDLEAGENPWLAVRPNSFGAIKTAAGRRQIPIGALMLPAECKELTTYYRAGPSLWPKRPFFFDPWLDRDRSGSWISAQVSAALKDVCGSDWTFHHLRHSAANNLLLALEGRKCESTRKLCEQLSGWSAEQQELVCKAITANPGNTQSHYVALAAFMGHADPSHTFRNYLHLVEPIMALRRARVSLADDAQLLADLLGRPLAWVVRRGTDGGLHDALEGRRRKTSTLPGGVNPVEVPASPQAPPAASNFLPTRGNDSTGVIAFLREAEKARGEEITASASKFGFPPAYALRLVGSACSIAELSTRGGKPRFQKPRDSTNPASADRGLLLPKPLRGNERGLINVALSRVQSAWGSPSNQAIIRTALAIFLRRHYADSTSLRLSKTELEPFVRFTDLAGIKLEVREGGPRAKAGVNRAACKSPTLRAKQYRVSIKWLTRSNRGTRALAIVCHWLAISYLTADEIRKMAREERKFGQAEAG